MLYNETMEHIRVITISRQLGSLGWEIASTTASHLGFQFYWREVLNKAALRSSSPEAALAAIDELGLLGICPSPKTCRAYRLAIEQVMVELANNGNVVILGRAGQSVLRNRPDTLHVRLVSSIQTRAERLSFRHNISLESALAQIEASDRYRRNYLKRHYQVRWDDPILYDLTISTERLSIESAVAIISQAAGYAQELPEKTHQAPQE